MLEKVHTYTTTATWSGDRAGVGQIDATNLSTQISVPTNLGGAGTGTNPEELLLSAAASCYVITLGLLLANRKVPYIRIDLESTGFLEYERGLRFDRIEHRPTIILDSQSDDAALLSMAEHAEHACMVSSAIRGNVEVKVIPRVVVQTTSQ